MKTKLITIQIEIPLNTEQREKWNYENKYIENVVTELLGEEIRHNVKQRTDVFETDDAYCKWSLTIEDISSEND